MAATDTARIATYNTDYSSYPNFLTFNTQWTPISDGKATVSVQATDTSSIGCSVDMKVGAGNEFFGVGLTGSFEFDYTRAYQSSASVTTSLSNPDPLQTGDINKLSATMYWLKPSPTAFWNPNSNPSDGHSGDTPSFITYQAFAIPLQ
jgi:hypothetical protein